MSFSTADFQQKPGDNEFLIFFKYLTQARITSNAELIVQFLNEYLRFLSHESDVKNTNLQNRLKALIGKKIFEKGIFANNKEKDKELLERVMQDIKSNGSESSQIDGLYEACRTAFEVSSPVKSNNIPAQFLKRSQSNSEYLEFQTSSVMYNNLEKNFYNKTREFFQSIIRLLLDLNSSEKNALLDSAFLQMENMFAEIEEIEPYDFLEQISDLSQIKQLVNEYPEHLQLDDIKNLCNRYQAAFQLKTASYYLNSKLEAAIPLVRDAIKIYKTLGLTDKLKEANQALVVCSYRWADKCETDQKIQSLESAYKLQKENILGEVSYANLIAILKKWGAAYYTKATSLNEMQNKIDHYQLALNKYEEAKLYVVYKKEDTSSLLAELNESIGNIMAQMANVFLDNQIYQKNKEIMEECVTFLTNNNVDSFNAKIALVDAYIFVSRDVGVSPQVAMDSATKAYQLAEELYKQHPHLALGDLETAKNALAEQLARKGFSMQDFKEGEKLLLQALKLMESVDPKRRDEILNQNICILHMSLSEAYGKQMLHMSDAEKVRACQNAIAHFYLAKSQMKDPMPFYQQIFAFSQFFLSAYEAISDYRVKLIVESAQTNNGSIQMQLQQDQLTLAAYLDDQKKKLYKLLGETADLAITLNRKLGQPQKYCHEAVLCLKSAILLGDDLGEDTTLLNVKRNLCQQKLFPAISRYSAPAMTFTSTMPVQNIVSSPDTLFGKKKATILGKRDIPEQHTLDNKELASPTPEKKPTPGKGEGHGSESEPPSEKKNVRRKLF